MLTRVAAVDCGTNSLRLLVAEDDGRGGLVELDRRLEIVRLGQGVDATGEFHPDALARTFAAAGDFAAVARGLGVGPEHTRVVATSAARDVRNREAFSAGMRARLGVDPDVVSGDTEARLSFVGALSRLGSVAGPVLVMDIGGGSTELITGAADGRVQAAVSLDVGSVRLTERFLPDSPPSVDQLARAAAAVDELLAGCPVDLSSVGTWVGVAGTVTSIAAVHLGLAAYDREAVHGSVLPAAALTSMLDRFSRLSADQIRGIATMHPQRADVITAGTLIAARVAAVVAAPELVVSESDILDGTALDLLRRRGAGLPAR